MASIVVSGDTSGTVTLQAPAVAGTTTLTLPATSGTLITTGGGAAGSFTTLTSTGASSFATSSGSVGIGTTSPNDKLDVNGTDAFIRVDRSNGEPGITFRYASSNTNRGDIAVTSGGAMYFTAGGSTERMRIDSSGNLLVGTTSATFTYTGAGQTATAKQVISTSGYDCINLISTGANPGIDFSQPNSASTIYRFANITGVMTTNTAGSESGALIFATGNAGANSAERMRIDPSGYVGIGTNSPSSYGALAVRKGVSGTWLGISSNSSFQTSDAINNSLYVLHSSANSSTTFIGTDAGGRLQMFCSSTAAGGVYLSNGGTSWTSASDERVKENLEPIEDGLTKITSLRAVTGNYINDETKKSKAFLIAQDVEKVLPQAVDSSNPDELGLQYTDTIPLLVAAIKELNQKVEAQAAEIAALKGAK